MLEYIKAKADKFKENYRQGHNPPLDKGDLHSTESLLRSFKGFNIPIAIWMIGMTYILFSEERNAGDGILFMLFITAYSFINTLKRIAENAQNEINELKEELTGLKARLNE